MPIDVKYDDRGVREALHRLAAAGKDLTPAMRDIAQALEAAPEDSFQSEQAPDGDPWAALSEHTKARRAKKGKTGKILQVEGRLANSITSRYDAFSAEAGSNLDYAATHQFGARKGEFGSTERGSPIPFGDVPARPFLGRSDELDAEILDAVNRYFLHAFRRR